MYKFKLKRKRIDRDEKLKVENMRRRPLGNEMDEHRVNRDVSNVKLKGIKVRTAGKGGGGKRLETGRFDDNTKGKE